MLHLRNRLPSLLRLCLQATKYKLLGHRRHRRVNFRRSREWRVPRDLAQRLVWESRSNQVVQEHTEAVNISRKPLISFSSSQGRADDFWCRIQDRSAVLSRFRIQVIRKKTAAKIRKLERVVGD